MITNDKTQQFVVIVLMMALAFYLQELPGSNVLQKALPELPFILTLYFAVSSRFFFGVISAFVVGMVQDVFIGIPTLGLHAAIYVIAAFVMIIIRLRFKHMNIFIQSFTIGVFVLVKILLVTLYETILYSPPVHLWALLSVPLSALVWPLLHLLFAFFAEKDES
ncbi:MAG: rod shape-determining protein MreD [Gammaproteobacteria bacterium]|nr:MAG: rod shape-determining protein MreD [Gammaproteobacteria bacterium]